MSGKKAPDTDCSAFFIKEHETDEKAVRKRRSAMRQIGVRRQISAGVATISRRKAAEKSGWTSATGC
ncbi:MAG: hypothetical protein LBF60_08540 [Treponema sp.]|jgi:hypothetical protein|nr:hypothetical protein [Treponema sp.]